MARNYTPSCLNLKNWLTSKKHVSTCLKKKLLTLDRVIITLARSTKEWKASSKILHSVWRTKRRLGEKLMHSPAYKSSPLSIRSMSGPTCRPRVAPLWRSWLALIKRMLLCLGTTGPMGPIRPNSNRKLTRVGKGAHLERRLRHVPTVKSLTIIHIDGRPPDESHRGVSLDDDTDDAEFKSGKQLASKHD